MQDKKFKHVVLFVALMFIAACQTINQNATNSSVTPITSTETSQKNNKIDLIEPTISPTEINSNFELEEESTNSILRLWHPFSGIEAEILKNLTEQYNQQMNGEVKILITAHADDGVLIEDIRSSFDSVDQPEIILAPSYFLKALANESYLLPIDSSKIDPNLPNSEAPIFPEFWNVDLLNEKRYGIPYLQEGNFLFYQEGWAEELGYVEAPKTIELFSQLSCTAFYNNLYDDELENNGTGGYYFPENPISITAWLRAFGGEISFNSRGEIVLNNEENLIALTFLFRLYDEGCAWWTNKEPFPYGYFSNRNSILFSGQSGEVFFQLDTMKENEINDKWGVIPYPSTDGKPIIFYDSYSFGITKKDEQNTEQALSFIEWMLMPEQHLKMVYSTFSFPLSNDEVQKIDKDWELYSMWLDTVQYIPFIDPIPQGENWYYAEKVMDDLGWQVIQYAIREEDLAAYLEEAEALINEMVLED